MRHPQTTGQDVYDCVNRENRIRICFQNAFLSLFQINLDIQLHLWDIQQPVLSIISVILRVLPNIQWKQCNLGGKRNVSNIRLFSIEHIACGCCYIIWPLCWHQSILYGIRLFKLSILKFVEERKLLLAVLGFAFPVEFWVSLLIKPLSEVLFKILTVVKDGLPQQCSFTYSRSSISQMWNQKISSDLLELVKSDFLSMINSLKTFDFPFLHHHSTW